MAQFLVSLYGASTPAGVVDDDSACQAHADYAQQIDAEGVLGFAGVVNNPGDAISLGKNDDAEVSADPQHLLVGIYVVQVDGGIEEALAIAQRNPILTQGGYLEVRELTQE